MTQSSPVLSPLRFRRAQVQYGDRFTLMGALGDLQGYCCWGPVVRRERDQDPGASLDCGRVTSGVARPRPPPVSSPSFLFVFPRVYRAAPNARAVGYSRLYGDARASRAGSLFRPHRAPISAGRRLAAAPEARDNRGRGRIKTPP